MVGESVVSLEQAYLERCDQQPCANLSLGVRHCFTYSPVSPSQQLGEAGDVTTMLQGPDQMWTNSTDGNATTHLTNSVSARNTLLPPFKYLAAGPGTSLVQVGTERGRSLGPYQATGHSKGPVCTLQSQLTPTTLPCCGAPSVPQNHSWRVGQELLHQTPVCRTVEHPP